mmetsp:Transcript_93479/g.264653  ORF Transcript_93479/g.264653 Transcript_93479/m.264653 type:complete len:234 (-) Transcript_93479:666-1367(-)
MLSEPMLVFSGMCRTSALLRVAEPFFLSPEVARRRASPASLDGGVALLASAALKPNALASVYGLGCIGTTWPPKCLMVSANSPRPRARGIVPPLKRREPMLIATDLRCRFSSMATRAPSENQWLPRSILVVPLRSSTRRCSSRACTCASLSARASASTFLYSRRCAARSWNCLTFEQAHSTKMLWFVRLSWLLSIKQTWTRIGGPAASSASPTAAKSPSATRTRRFRFLARSA